MSEISDRLLSEIERKQYSYGELARITGIPKSAIQRYATGGTPKIPMDRLETLATALGVSPEYLLGWNESREDGDFTNFDKERFREAMGEMSSADLARKLDCPKSSISMYLSGQREPSKMAVQLIALNLGVNPAWLAGLDVPKFSNAKIISVKEKTAAEAGSSVDEKHARLLELFDLLSDDQKEMIIAQLRGLVLRQTARDEQ